RSTTPGMPSLSRLKSMRRYFCREPPPMWRVVMRPKWLRAPVLLCATVKGRCGPPLCRCERSIFTTARVPGVLGLYLMRAICESVLSGLGASFVVDRLPLDQAHVRLLPVLGAAGALAEAAHLARLADDVHTRDLDVEHELDRLADVGLGRVAACTEGVLVVVLHRERGLLGDVRGDQNAHQLLAVHNHGLRPGLTGLAVRAPSMKLRSEITAGAPRSASPRPPSSAPCRRPRAIPD